ncbi:MAG: DUF362 domain-containing protein [Chloroflexi bacterium]|nr:DUF362 domain-containing protein [Chloroflexota bacterium]
MKKSKVAVVRCTGYDDELVYGAIKRGMELMGGISCYVKPGEKIVLKPNVLWGSDPEKCVTTHPAVFKAVGRLLQEAGAKLTYGDSAGFGKSEAHVQRAGLKRAADELGIALADFDSGQVAVHRSGLLNKRFIIANGILAAEGVVSMPKLKTHGLTRLTGAIKNQFGCIPGTIKGQFHLKMPDPYDFATMLVDLNSLIRPRLFIMDGIIAMEGNGPRNGNPRKLNVLLLSSDPVALDSIACKIIDLNPEFVPTSKPGEKAGLGTYHYDEIETVGDDVDSFITRDFDVIRRPPVPATSGRIRTFLKNRVTPRPVIDKAKCTRCGVCSKVCPVEPKAIEWNPDDKSKFPEHKYDLCIRCYCCQELCPEGAISIKNTLLGSIISR